VPARILGQSRPSILLAVVAIGVQRDDVVEGRLSIRHQAANQEPALR